MKSCYVRAAAFVLGRQVSGKRCSVNLWVGRGLMLVHLLREGDPEAKVEIWRVVQGTMSHRSMMVVLLPRIGRKSVRMRQHLLVLELATWWSEIWLIQPMRFDAIRDGSFQRCVVMRFNDMVRAREKWKRRWDLAERSN